LSGGLQEYSAREACFVQWAATTTTQDDINQGTFIIVVEFASL